MNYTPLNIKTDNSLLESMIKVKDLIEYSKGKYNALTITDNTMFGVMEFYELCKQNGIKPIIGLEVTYKDLKYVLYAMDNDGYKNLVKICTIIKTEELTIDIISKYSKSLICILPYESKNIYQELNKIYKHFYIGYKNLEQLSKLKGNNLVYMNEIKALNKKDTPYLKYLKAIKEGCNVDSLIEENNDSYLLSEEEILKLYPESIKNNKEIVSLCDVEIKKENDLMPIFKCPDNMDSYSYLKKLCINGLKEKFGSKTYQVYIDRLKYELDIINKMGFCNYFLIVSDYVNYAKKNNIFCHARGSAAGSLVAYLLNITDVDPIRYNLLFERFLNPMRVSMPDIDMDFEDTKREQVINYVKEKYGVKNVSGIVTFITFKPKLAIRDVGRALDFNADEIDMICKLLKESENHHSLTLKDNIKINKPLINYLNESKERLNLYHTALKIENLKKATSIHAAGIIISKKELDTVIPLIKSNDMYLASYTMNYLENLGLLKMDFLGLRNLTIITNIIEDINKEGIKVDFNKIPLDDKETLEIFESANTIGIFQFESDGMRKFLEKLKPSSFEDIFAALALYRPGPMQNIDSYIRRKNGKEKINYFHPSLEAILKPTYGIIVYQEQIMQIANVMAGYTLGEADLLRKAISKKKDDIMLENMEEFKTRALKNGYEEKVVDEVSKFIIKFAEYGFNRSHSVAYALIAYKLAYLKAHYKSYFMRYIMTNAIGRNLSTKDYIYECKKNNIEIEKPSINESYKEYVIQNGKIVYPLSNIKNVGTIVVDEILNKRKNGRFKDIYDFIKRCYSKSINKKVLTSLVMSGCFDEFNINKKTLIYNLDEIINYGELLKDIDEEYALKPDIEYQDEYSKEELMNYEFDTFGFYLSNHPVTDIKIKYQNSIDIKDINNYFNRNIVLIASIKYIKEIVTKKNEAMLFITVEDETSYTDVTVFPRVLKNLEELKVNSIIKVEGKVERRYDKYQIIAHHLEIIKEG